MAYDPRAVANEVLVRAWERGYEPTQLDIQKITYFLHGHHLQDHGVPLVKDDFEALHYGPVQRSLLDAFSKFGEEPIRMLAKKFDPILRTHSELPRLTDNAAVATIDTYLERYLAIPSYELVDMTHARGTPWSQTIQRARKAVNIGMKISNDLIRSSFEGIKFA